MTRPTIPSETLAETVLSLRETPRPAPLPLATRAFMGMAAVAVGLILMTSAPARAELAEAISGIVRTCADQILRPAPATCMLDLEASGPTPCNAGK